MKRRSRSILIAAAVVVAALITYGILVDLGVFNIEVWKRESPLPNPTQVTSVNDGAITLADGRVLRPAGVSRRNDVSTRHYDEALRTVVAQGVVVIRDLGDGTAFFLTEPKFYNWCGTRGYNGNPWARWAGSYLQCPLSELLVQTAYAKPNLDQPGLTPKERWRLEGVEHLSLIADAPTRISSELNALRYDPSVTYLADYDATLEQLWTPPPSR